jgi:cytochrome c553
MQVIAGRQQLALGKRYYQGMCAYYHGAQGGGNEPHATPALRRQNYVHLLMQMRLLAVGHRYSVDPAVTESLNELSFDQLTAMADYASRPPMIEVPGAMPARAQESTPSGH